MGNNVNSIGMGVFWGLQRTDHRRDPQQRHQHREQCVLWLHRPDQCHDGQHCRRYIGNSAFEDCSSLTTIAIPASVSYIEDYAFYGCSSLTAITVDPANYNYYSPDGVLFNKSQTTLLQYPEAKAGSYIIPDSVTSLEYAAFNYCTNLTSLTIDNNVASLGNYEFYGCSSLASVTIGTGVTSLGYDAFAYCTSLANVTIPGHVTSIGSQAFYDDSSLTTSPRPGCPSRTSMPTSLLRKL